MDEAIHKAKLVKALHAEPGVRVQRFEDAFAVGLVDMLVAWGNGAIWLEAKYHVLTPTGVLLPASKLTGNQRAWLQNWDFIPHPTAVILFTDKGWLVCPTKHISLLHEEPICNTRHLLLPYPVKSFRTIMKSYEQVKEWGCSRKSLQTIA